MDILVTKYDNWIFSLIKVSLYKQENIDNSTDLNKMQSNEFNKTSAILAIIIGFGMLQFMYASFMRKWMGNEDLNVSLVLQVSLSFLYNFNKNKKINLKDFTYKLIYRTLPLYTSIILSAIITGVLGLILWLFALGYLIVFGNVPGESYLLLFLAICNTMYFICLMITKMASDITGHRIEYSDNFKFK